MTNSNRFGRAVLFCFTALICLFLILPNIIVLPISFSPTFVMEFPPRGLSLQWYETYLTQPGWVAATITSFKVGVAVMVISVVLGSLAAYGLVRGDFRGKQILNSLVILPMIVPHLIIAIAIYRIFSPLGLVGSYPGLVLAHVVVALPFVFIIMTAALRSQDVQYERAAINLGAGRITALRLVVFPMVKPAVISSSLFAFLISFDELMIALFLSSPTMSTLPKKLWDGIRLEITPTLAAVSTILIVVSVIIIGLSAWLTKRSAEK